MLSRLSISNYALINTLQVDFHKNLNSVTGETGAGKSIILGALGLILGNRADLSSLKNKDVKCIVEGHFRIEDYRLESFFEDEDLDYDELTILRREITPSGKSRAFINDTPVNLKTIRALGLKLIDIHSQHQNLELSNQRFQLELVDAVAGNGLILEQYKKLYGDFKKAQRKLLDVRERSEKAKADLDYFQFQYNQLEEAKLQENEQDELEAELEKLNHAEDIKAGLTEASQLLDSESMSVIQSVKESQRSIERISSYLREAGELSERLHSAFFELKDILDEAEALAERVDINPARQEEVNERLNQIYSLQQKHNVASVRELIELRDGFDAKINQAVGYEEEINKLNEALQQQQALLHKKGHQLSEKRKKTFPTIEKSIVNDLTQLGMPKARLKIEHSRGEDFTDEGCDTLSFLFSANADSVPNEISKIASGGEMSRLMLAIKNLLRSSKALPTVIFDEIDTGVSGEIALKMGTIIKTFSSDTQIINITHLPQIAAKGDAHFRVYKQEEGNKTFTSIKQLNDEERVLELAKMVGGEKPSDTTLRTAKELLTN